MVACISSCSNSDNGELEKDFLLSTENISINYGKVGEVEITSGNASNCVVTSNNPFVAEGNIIDNKIIIKSNHIGNAILVISLNNKEKKVNVNVKGNTKNLCGSPLMMFGSSFESVKDSIFKIKDRKDFNNSTTSKIISYGLYNEEKDFFVYSYYFVDNKLKAIIIEVPNYSYLHIQEYQENMYEKYNYIKTSQVMNNLNHSFYKDKNNINIISCEKLNTNNGPDYYGIVVDISDDMEFLLDSYNFYSTGYPRYIN